MFLFYLELNEELVARAAVATTDKQTREKHHMQKVKLHQQRLKVNHHRHSALFAVPTFLVFEPVITILYWC